MMTVAQARRWARGRVQLAREQGQDDDVEAWETVVSLLDRLLTSIDHGNAQRQHLHRRVRQMEDALREMAKFATWTLEHPIDKQKAREKERINQ